MENGNTPLTFTLAAAAGLITAFYTVKYKDEARARKLRKKRSKAAARHRAGGLGGDDAYFLPKGATADDSDAEDEVDEGENDLSPWEYEMEERKNWLEEQLRRDGPLRAKLKLERNLLAIQNEVHIMSPFVRKQPPWRDRR